MNLEDYKFNMRRYRGHLKSMDNELNDIWTKGSEKFINYTLGTKQMGIKKLSYIATNLSEELQDELLGWLAEKPRMMKEIEVKLLSLI